jgi:two-component system, NarL family, sensor histidine kinase BarA
VDRGRRVRAVSYRSFKHLLGETSLERKCRFIFGLGILVLVSGSFFWYGQKTENLVLNQTTQMARLIVPEALYHLHVKELGNSNFLSVLEVISGSFKPLKKDLPYYKAKVMNPFKLKEEGKEGLDDFERKVVLDFLQTQNDQDRDPKTANAKEPGLPGWKQRYTTGRTEYQYIQAVYFESTCLMNCHGKDESGADVPIDNHLMRPAPDGEHWVPTKVGDLAGAVAVTLPMKQTINAINLNRAMLITAALITAIIAMLSSYIIVRYVIVKPVKHLRDVSDAIAAGRLTIRSQIETGDEFEELSHAFNRMLYNLVAMQQALREVNNDLDKKVDELAQANLALFEMNRLKSDFLATMSHELRTPLNSIIGFSEVLSGADQLNERHRRYAGNIQSSGKMLLSMINDILDLAKIESGKMEVRSEDFSIRDVCEGLTNLSRPIAERKNITLECRIDEAIPLLRQDPGKLRQIIYNLLSNAIKFTPEGGRVTLRARAEGRIMVVEVQDTGIGIAEEDRETIFEKFRQAKLPGQADNVLTREYHGTGLGLSIVRELTKLLGGDVQLESQAGQGSTFTVRIPLLLPGNRKFEVTLADERIDLSKARRIEPHPPLPHLAIGRTPPSLPEGEPVDPARGRKRNPSVT